MKNLLKLTSLFILALTLSACSTAKNFYNNYVNPPAKMNYKNIADLSPKEAFLADNLLLISDELSAFEREFDLISHPPVPEEIDALFSRYPWLSGLILLHPSGSVAGALPVGYPQFDFNSFLEVPKKADERAIRAYLQNDSTLVLAKPVFDTTNEFLGLTLIYFDYNRLAMAVGLSNNIIALAPRDEAILSSHALANSPLLSANLNKKINSRSSDTIKDKKLGNTYWIVRYFYDYPLVFAIEE